MTLALLFWILMLLWLLRGAYVTYSSKSWEVIGGDILLFLLVLVLGVAQFGAPIK